MIYLAPDPVPSGQEFVVLAVNGRTPRLLTDFVGDAVFTLRWADQDRLVTGRGRTEGADVRFHEKDVDHGGKDVRVWTVRSADQTGRFTACTVGS